MSAIGRWLRWLYPEFDDYGIALSVHERREIARRFPPVARELARADGRPRTLIVLGVGALSALGLAYAMQAMQAPPLTALAIGFGGFVIWGVAMVVLKQSLHRGVERAAIERLLREMGRLPADGAAAAAPPPTDPPGGDAAEA